MTRAQGYANWAGNPSLCDQLIASTLHTLAMLASILAYLLKMRPSRVPGECHTDVTPEALPEAERDPTGVTLLLPTTAASGVIATRIDSQEGLMVSSERSSRPSNHEAGLTGEHEQPQQQQRNNTATLQSPNKVREPIPLNASFSGLSRESRFERQGNSQDSHRRTNQDSRDALRLPENDALRGLRYTSAA